MGRVWMHAALEPPSARFVASHNKSTSTVDVLDKGAMPDGAPRTRARFTRTREAAAAFARLRAPLRAAARRCAPLHSARRCRGRAVGRSAWPRARSSCVC
eukprot:6138022-Prymnesium_polylepis.1